MSRPFHPSVGRRTGLLRAALVVAAVGAAGPAFGQSAKPVPDLADFARLVEIRAAKISPDGKLIAFVEGHVEPEKNKSRTELRLMSVDGTAAPSSKLVPTASDGVGAFLWSPAGDVIAYIGGVKSDAPGADAPKAEKNAASGGSWIWTVNPATGENRKIVRLTRSNHYLAHSGAGWCFSPDGTHIAYVAADPDAAGPAADPRVITRIQYKNKTGFADGKNSHIWTVEVATGKTRRLTDGKFDEHSIDWSPDGSEIVFCSNREPDPDANLNYDLFTVKVADGSIRRLTRTAANEMQPAWSPDGKQIVFLKTGRPPTTIDSVAEDDHVWVMEVATGETRDLTAELDRRCYAPRFGDGGRGVYFLARDRGRTLIYRVPAEGGEATPVFMDDVRVESYSLRADGEAGVYIRSGPREPPEIARFTLEHRARMTETNLEIVEKWKLPEPAEIACKSADGTPVHGWLLLPRAATEAKKVPMILDIHGGPHGMWGYRFEFAHHALAARGYAVLYVNPRGSSGYGQKFADGCRNDWGGGDWRDLMSAVDHVVASRPEIDAKRLGVMGGSYGGYMTMWAVTQTDRFKAAVAYAGLSNLISFYGNSLYQDLIHVEFGGFPWDKYKILWERSPLAHVKNVKTPTLLTHGEADMEVPVGQSEEFFTALRYRGVDTMLVRYPRQGHGPGEPKHVLDGLKRTAEWFDKYLK